MADVVAGIAGKIPGVSDLYGGLTADEQNYLTGQLQTQIPQLLGVPDGVQQAVSAVQGLGPAAEGAVKALSGGNAVTAIEGTVPLISGALALVPGVGLPAAAVVAAGGQLFGLIADALHLGAQPPPEACAWKLGRVCFPGPRPYGPSAPDWLTLDEFANAPLTGQAWLPIPANLDMRGYTNWLELIDAQYILSGGGGPATYNGVPYTQVAWELYALGDRGTVAMAWHDAKIKGGFTVADNGTVTNNTGYSVMCPAAVFIGTPMQQFLLTYYRALVHTWEMGLNGYQIPDYYNLLLATTDAFNRTHQATIREVFSAVPSGNKVPSISPAGPTFIEMLLGGQVDGKEKPRLIVNQGTWWTQGVTATVARARAKLANATHMTATVAHAREAVAKKSSGGGLDLRGLAGFTIPAPTPVHKKFPTKAVLTAAAFGAGGLMIGGPIGGIVGVGLGALFDRVMTRV